MDIVINLIFTVVGAFVKEIRQVLYKSCYKKQLREVLSCDGECRITLQYIKKYYGGRERIFVQLADVSLYSKVKELITELGIKVTELSDSEFDGHEIHIGSPMANPYSNRYVLDSVPDFKWHVSRVVYEEAFKELLENTAMKHQNFVEFDEEWNGYIINGDKHEYKKDVEDYAFFLRLVRDDLPHSNHKTIHVIFGIGGTIGRKGAGRYFTKYYRSIYKQYKKDIKRNEKFQNYLYAMQLDCNGNPNGPLKLLWHKKTLC